MSKYFTCCEKCVETIGKKSCSSARLWMELCQLRQQFLLVRGRDNPDIRRLEIMGFVCSTDLPEHLIIRINGHRTIDGEDRFCIRALEHE